MKLATTSVETKMKKSEATFTSTFVGLSGYPSSVGAYTSSPTVELEDRLWTVRIYPGGIDEDSKGFLSCFVACESLETTRASFRISVLNQKGWKNHHYVSDTVKQFQNFSSNSVNYWGDPKFISKANLSTPSNGICVDDKIIIRVELTIYGALEQYIRTPNAVPQHVGGLSKRKTILDDLNFLLTDRSLADVTLLAPEEEVEQPNTTTTTATVKESRSHVLHSITESRDEDGEQQSIREGAAKKLGFEEAVDHDSNNNNNNEDFNNTKCTIDTNADREHILVRLPAHKFILSLRSPVFRAMFQAEMSEAATSEVLIEDFDAPVMQEFLRFLYTDRLDRSALERYAEQLLAAACKYQVPGLESLCENHLCASLGVHNVVSVLYLSDLYNAEQLKARALHYIAHNAKEVVQADGFFQSLSFGLCQEVIRALAGVEPSVSLLDGQPAHLNSSVLPSPSTDSSPGRPFVDSSLNR